MTIIIELFLCVTFLILIYQCCIKGARARPSPHDHLPDGISDNPVDDVREDLEQFRRLRRNSVENQSGDAVAARKELIKMNLFSRQICREESVKELSQILAISRGGGGRSVLDTDEEMGLCTVEGQEENSANDEVDIDLTNTPHELSAGKAATQADADLSTVATTSTAFPSPSAPSISTTDAVVTAIHDVQTTQSTLQETTQISNADPHAIPTLGPLRQLWTSWTHNNEKVQPSAQEYQPEYNPHSHPLECSICLEIFSPNDKIAWAKDGGEPTSNSTRTTNVTANDTICDHIFHEECLVSWLQLHDECPLCRRKIVHSDAEIRFAGWEGSS
eukprot:g13341.t1 g13341   contig8:444655-445650(-)